jgi:hypothetical protein
MKRTGVFLLLITLCSVQAFAQKTKQTRTFTKRAAITANSSNANSVTSTAIVIDDRLSVLREQPSLYARPIQRLRRGREVQIIASREADGITFYRVLISRNVGGWMQSESVAGRFRLGDDERLARLFQTSDDYEQIELGTIFLKRFADSPLRPAILLLFGDLAEEQALKISKDATKKLVRAEMAASGAPLHSFYLNYTSLDRFQKLGLTFLFNSSTKTFHYNGESWREIIEKFPKANEANEAQKRLDSLKSRLEAVK